MVASKVVAPATPAVAKVVLAKGEVREEMAIEDWQVGYIIGKGGSRAKHIQNSFGVQIVCVDITNPKAVILGKKQNGSTPRLTSALCLRKRLGALASRRSSMRPGWTSIYTS